MTSVAVDETILGYEHDPSRSHKSGNNNNPIVAPTLSTLPKLVYIRIFQLLDDDHDTATCLSLVHSRIYPFHLSTHDILAAKRRAKAGLPPAGTPPPRYRLIQSHLPVIRHIYWRGRYGRDDDVRAPVYGLDPVRCVKKPFAEGSNLPTLLREFMGKVGLAYKAPYSLQFVTPRRFIQLRNEWEMSEQACVALSTREQIEASTMAVVAFALAMTSGMKLEYY
ncbi:hypothetical protein BJ875DRAFT_540424 [Amylocarpus encephaloides]|uniref:Uncharacterized protein n=1 Tax=Amylocarpus encephaloides TaxID=45428 RepID=A0A9P7YQP8_9HELO|nr:hypothetical protein BJ875DRAFT_540424 [Amylocarpus encephaloides]